jgi:hypothetical protein
MSCAAPYPNYGNVRPPGATAKNTLTVGAQPSGGSAVSDFTSWGPTDDGRLKPEFVVTGDELGGDGGVTAPVPGDAYAVLGGTSMSTAGASGAAALLVQDFRALAARDPLPATIKALVCHTAEDLDRADLAHLNPGPDYASGYGALRLKEAVDQLRGGDWIEGEVDQAGSDAIALEVPSDATHVRVTLAWDDVAGSELAATALVNDLDLVVRDPNGVRRFPWTLDPATPAADAARTGEDHRNPLEQVLVDAGLVPGAWSIEVRGTTVPFGPQGYSLVFDHDGSPPATDAGNGAAPALTARLLAPAHPNPFGPWTVIAYRLPAGEARVTLRVLDVQGRVVETLVAGEAQGAGRYTYTWRGRGAAGRDAPSGVYLVELTAGARREIAKVLLAR